jgi:hypothetical protein
MPVLFEQSLTVLYRVLFLLFAEARGLLPVWHPVYRDRYSLDTIVTCAAARAALSGTLASRSGHLTTGACRMPRRRASGHRLQRSALFAVASGHVRSHTDCRHGDEPGRRRGEHDADRRHVQKEVPDETPTTVRARIVYRDLDVEQLGAVYERVLEYEPSPGATLVRTREIRKSSGTFYTPRALTGFLIRQTLAPLVKGRSAAEILRLRILDPAMGSGAFLSPRADT